MSEGSAKRNPRKPKKALTLVERISVIRMYETLRNTRKLAALFGCGRTQIQNILRRQQEYLEEWSGNGDPNRIKSRHSARLLMIGAIVYEWIQRFRCYGLTLNQELIRQTAQKVARMLNMPEFRANNTWYQRLKHKYKIDNLGPSSFFKDPNVPRKSLRIEDIISDLKNPKCKNFLLLPENLPYDPLENFEKGSKPSKLRKEVSTDDEGESFNIELSECEEVVTENGNDLGQHIFTLSGNMEIEVIKSEPDSAPDLNSSYLSGDKHISVNGTSRELMIIEGQNEEVAMEAISEENKDDFEKNLISYKEALKHLRPLEEFALTKGDIRAVGLINQLENLFKEKTSKEENYH